MKIKTVREGHLGTHSKIEIENKIELRMSKGGQRRKECKSEKDCGYNFQDKDNH